MKSAGPAISAMVLVLATLLLLYVLLLGPAVWLHERGILVKQIEIAYFPLEWAAHHTSIVEITLRPYVELWSPEAPAPPPPAAPVATPAPAGS